MALRYVSKLIFSISICVLVAGGASAQCLVPEGQIVSGGVGRDGIPALTSPEIVSETEGDSFLVDQDLVLGVTIQGEARAYPHAILWWHEIVNDVLGGKPIVVSFCPLTGSGLVYDAVIQEGQEPFNFGVSGLLFDNNLILFDRTTETLWSQMRIQGICGPLRETVPTTLPLVQSTWAAWKAMHPETTVLSFNTGFNRNYNRYPYGDYDRLDNNDLLFPQSVIDNRLPLKETVFGIKHDGVARAYSVNVLSDVGSRVAVNDDVNGRLVLVVFDRDSFMVMGFDRKLSDPTLAEEMALHFDVVDEGIFPFKLKDRETGTLWSLAGLALEGPLAGAELQPTGDGFTAFWFAWSSFNVGTEIYEPATQ